jgi:hypothetical protein
MMLRDRVWTAGLPFFLMLVSVNGASAKELGQVGITIASSKAEYVLGEMIELTVEIKNRGDSRLRLPGTGGLSASREDLISYAATAHGEPEQKDFVPLSRAGPLLASGVLVLEPGAAVSVAYDGLMLPVGRHQLVIRYSHEPRYAETTDIDGLWRGEAQSSPLAVSVRMPEPEEQRRLDEEMKNLATRLRHASPDTRRRYALLMPRYLPASREFVRLLLEDKDPSVRAQALVDVGRLGTDEDGVPLGTCMIADVARKGKTEENRWVKIRVSQVLSIAEAADAESRSLALTVLEKYLRDPNPEVKGHAANSLIHVWPQKAAQLITNQLAAKEGLHPTYRNLLAQALFRKTGEADIQKALAKLLANDGNSVVAHFLALRGTVTSYAAAVWHLRPAKAYRRRRPELTPSR